ncbi:peptidase M28-like protein [Tenacibaculum adriaticum]|uniref:Peptidase M28-like protein n=1 Tax=Tenacibaculum adriaticum TaxID=413713 RepID=A0A5S5DV36_9FLAO|nr:M20/M25/M40 family metallo-hydrolase [Tenacibaculum adriaticum]TYP99584.1 peptidase M28-like protein [Tenacibaculum adriaticum]
MKTPNKLLTLIIILITIYGSFSSILPRYKTENKSLEKTEFSVNKALLHLKNISQKAHYTGSEEHKVVKNYLFDELKKLGLEPEIQVKTAFNKKWIAGTTVENIIATIKGESSEKSLLLLSHYDSNPHSAIGSADAGSGIVTILEGIRVFLEKNKTPKNDIVILFSDAEELGLLGAEAFVQHHPLAKNVGLVLNFEARGSGGPSYMLMETNGKNSKLLTEFLKAQPHYPAANSLMYSVYKMLPNDTDLTVFREKNNINGFNFAFIGNHFDYHTAQDNYDRLDRSSLLHQIDYFTTTLNYFSNADLTNLNSTEDYVYVNFPLMKLLIYPFSWIGILLIVATIVLLIIIYFGLKKGKLTIPGMFKGFVPFLSSLLLCGIISYFLWKLLVIIHPQYQDMLHGFTYNGYQYIATFIFLNLWILIKTYNQFKNEKTIDLLIAPIVIWLLINLVIYQYLQGAGFFIIPVFIALLILSIQLFTNLKKRNQPILFAFLSVPTLYIFAPLIKMFPVGLGLKNLFISGILLALIFGLLLPAFHQQKKIIPWQKFVGFLTILLFAITTFNSGFSIDKKRPNSLVYIQNEDSKTSYWGTYNKTLDSYTSQIFDNNYQKGSIPNAETKSKYNTHFKYHKKTDYKDVRTSLITVELDTIINNDRHLKLTLLPQRKINKFELFNNSSITIKSLTANNTSLYDDADLEKGTLLIYHMANSDKELKISLVFNEKDKPSFTVNEISYDLLSHPKFNLLPRSDAMMPMPFVTNDAIICTKTINL